jgi:hypothetical protein
MKGDSLTDTQVLDQEGLELQDETLDDDVNKDDDIPYTVGLALQNPDRGGRWLMGNRVTCCGGAQRGD